MSLVSQKCQYAMRAVFELAKRQGEGPVKIHAVAEAQGIPQRFLESILNQLKQTGIVESRRGKDGGYILVRDARDVTVGEVMALVQGPPKVVDCLSGPAGKPCIFDRDCVFWPFWESVREALASVYDGTTFHDLVEQDKERSKNRARMYSI